MKRTSILLADDHTMICAASEGRWVKEAAYTLQISQGTVRFHRYRIMEEPGVESSRF
jgi:DNA-binding NarL/FixJ family response regulator